MLEPYASKLEFGASKGIFIVKHLTEDILMAVLSPDVKHSCLSVCLSVCLPACLEKEDCRII